MTTKVKSGDILATAILTTGTQPNYLLTIPGEVALTDQEVWLVKFHDTASTAVTINVNSIGAAPLKDELGVAVSSIAANIDYRIKRDVAKAAFIVVGGGAGGGLSSVTHDATLTGDGTPGDPLSVTGLMVFAKIGTTAAMSGATLNHTDADATATSVVSWTASSTPNGFIQVDVGTAGHIIFTSTASETCSFTYLLTK